MCRGKWLVDTEKLYLTSKQKNTQLPSLTAADRQKFKSIDINSWHAVRVMNTHTASKPVN